MSAGEFMNFCLSGFAEPPSSLPARFTFWLKSGFIEIVLNIEIEQDFCP